MRVLLLTLALAGCGATIPEAPRWKPDASLLTLCPETLPLLDGGTGKDILPWGIEARKDYETCAARHKRLVEAIPK